MLELGNIEIHRDWGWAPDYVEAMWKMLQHTQADDFVIATGTSHSLAYFIERAFAWFELDWRSHVRFNNQLRRPSDISVSQGNPSKAFRDLGWRAQFNLEALIDEMCAAVAAEKN